MLQSAERGRSGMTTFAMLSALARALLALWALLLCLTNIASGVLAAVKKRLLYTAFALVIFVPCYFMWQVIFDFSLFGKTEKATDISVALCNYSILYWLLALVLLTAAAALLFCFNIRYDKTYITPGAIKLYLDRIPCGICCWRENGRVLFSNICMNRLCVKITGSALLNGNIFRDALKSKILTADGKVWRFAYREITLGGERLFEMIASDITDEYAKTQALEKDKEELSRLNKELSDYYLSIDESVKRQEILQAKMNIHDEMNRLMLSTVAANGTDAEALDNIFSLWEQNALLLCMQADNEANAQQTDSAETLANALGINLIWNGELSGGLDDEQRELFFFTLQEAIINSAKHAQAKTVEISFEQTQTALICRFTNDGTPPQCEVRFEGGLANLARLAEKRGAALSTETVDKFTLVLILKNQPLG